MPRPLTLAVVALALAAIAAGSWWLHARVEAAPAAAEPRALPVRTAPLDHADHFVREARYAGRIEPARATTLAFEQPGLVSTIRVDEGDRVAAGEVLARQDTRLRDAERARLVAERAALTARIELATRTERRQSALEGRGFSATQALDEARFTRAQLQAERAAVDAAIARLDVALDKAILRAPFAGTIAGRRLDDGATVASGTPVVELLETGRLEARIGLPPRAAAGIGVGDAVTLEADGRTLDATVAAKRPDLAERTRTLPVRFTLQDPAAAPPTGTLVTLARDQRVDARGFWVPTTVLERAPKGLFQVPLAVPTGQGWRRGAASVEVLFTSSERAFVRGPVPAGAELVLAGAHRVAAGAALTPIAE